MKWVLSTSNGVKQGWILSPILFGVYINNLPDELENSRAGCYISHIFIVAFRYVNHIILPAHSKFFISFKIIKNKMTDGSHLFL